MYLRIPKLCIVGLSSTWLFGDATGCKYKWLCICYYTYCYATQRASMCLRRSELCPLYTSRHIPSHPREHNHQMCHHRNTEWKTESLLQQNLNRGNGTLLMATEFLISIVTNSLKIRELNNSKSALLTFAMVKSDILIMQIFEISNSCSGHCLRIRRSLDWIP